jgi:ABC-type Fe3+-hydroxamate transport system substrate-binding protein
MKRRIRGSHAGTDGERRLLSRVAFILFLSIVAATPASMQASIAGPKTSSVSARDSRGETISLDRTALRIASLSPGAAEALFAIGAGDQIIGRGQGCDYPVQANSVPIIGIRDIAARRPDLVIFDSSIPSESARLESGTTRAFFWDPRDFAELARLVMALGTLTGHEAAGIKEAARITGAVRSVALIAGQLPASGRKTVLWSTAADRLAACGEDSFAHAMMEAAGGRDAFQDRSASQSVTPKDIASRRVQAIVIAPARAPSKDETDAVSALVPAGIPILWLEPALGYRIGPRSPRTLLEVARFLHPELFP